MMFLDVLSVSSLTTSVGKKSLKETYKYKKKVFVKMY